MQILGYLPLLFAGIAVIIWGLTSLWTRRRDRKLDEFVDEPKEKEYVCLICGSGWSHNHVPREINDYIVGSIQVRLQEVGQFDEKMKDMDEEFYQEAVKECEQELEMDFDFNQEVTETYNKAFASLDKPKTKPKRKRAKRTKK